MKVVSPPLAKFTSFCNTGKLAEDKVCLPETNESQRVPFLKKKEERLEKLQNSMIEYHKAAAIIQGHRIFIFRMFVVTLIQRD